MEACNLRTLSATYRDRSRRMADLVSSPKGGSGRRMRTTPKVSARATCGWRCRAVLTEIRGGCVAISGKEQKKSQPRTTEQATYIPSRILFIATPGLRFFYSGTGWPVPRSCCRENLPLTTGTTLRRLGEQGHVEEADGQPIWFLLP